MERSSFFYKHVYYYTESITQYICITYNIIFNLKENDNISRFVSHVVLTPSPKLPSICTRDMMRFLSIHSTPVSRQRRRSQSHAGSAFIFGVPRGNFWGKQRCKLIVSCSVSRRHLHLTIERILLAHKSRRFFSCRRLSKDLSRSVTLASLSSAMTNAKLQTNFRIKGDVSSKLRPHFLRTKLIN